ncbi:MAG: PIN domain-containing protein, partial [Candidatus Pacearchaeota archaeon]
MVVEMIFIDSNILIAYFNEADKNHYLSKEILARIDKLTNEDVFISDYVFDELVTVTLLKKKSKKTAIEAGKEILKSRIRILKVNQKIFQKAWELFQNSELKMSFTDFTNLAFLEILKIERIATFDKD